LALLIVLGSFVPNTTTPVEAELTVVQEGNTPIATQKTVRYPLEGYVVSQGFSLFHPAVDLAAPFGSPIYPVKDGVVADISYSRFAYGNAVIIDHGNQVTSLYAHLAKIEVEKGQKVTTLTEIGKSGSTGHSTGPHLHLEIRNHGVPVNPFAVLPSPVSPI